MKLVIAILLISFTLQGQKSSSYEKFMEEVNSPSPKTFDSSKKSNNTTIDKNTQLEKSAINEASKSKEEEVSGTEDIPEIPIGIDHTPFTSMLSKYVDDKGNVNYSAWKKEESTLNEYLKNLKSTDVSSLSRDEQLAFWINAYNAFTVKLILKNHPVNSIKDINNGKPWDSRWIVIDGNTFSLNQIENEIIRPTFNEPRIHFAVNCAATSCPPLRNEAFTAEKLDAQLEEQTKNFITNQKYNKLSESTIEVSKIFDWYQKDFGNIASYINSYTEKDVSEAKVAFTNYDWSLNGK